MTTVLDAPVVITDPGVYDLPDDVYHRDPVPGGSLSSTGARKLLPPHCPALYRHESLQPPKPKATFDFGHAAHKLVLGSGPELVGIDAKDWRTNAAKEQRDAAHAAGQVPLLLSDLLVVEEMAAAILEHPVASALFNPDLGKAEQSLFWQDEQTGITRRARLDWLPNAADGRMIVGDYKTTISAEPDSFSKSCATYGYHQQAPWYIDGVKALGLADDVAFVFVAQEKTAPYLISVFQLDPEAMDIGRRLNRLAIEVYAECKATDTWPSYTSDVTFLALPSWYAFTHGDRS